MNTGIKDTNKLVETVEFLARKSNKHIDNPGLCISMILFTPNRKHPYL